MRCVQSIIPCVKIFELERIRDQRGWLMECYQEEELRFYGIKERFIQENHAYTEAAGTLRGLHFQAPPCAQSKLVRCTAGETLHVAVDIRPDSRTFEKWVMTELTAANARMIYIPKGFAHGYLTLADGAEIQYKVDLGHIPEAARSLYYADPHLDIPWGIAEPILSRKDSQRRALSWEELLEIL